MSDAPVLYECKDSIGLMTLNRPENRNSMTPEVLQGVVDTIAQVRADPDVRCLVITGKGRSFCAGADFKSNIQHNPGGRELLSNERSFEMYKPFLSVLEVEVPVIGALNGHAIGGGMGLALVCDIRVANQESRYGANFTRLGLHPGMATTYLLPRIVGMPKAAELLLTGRLMSGAEAAEIGLMNYAVAEDQVFDKAWGLAEEVAQCAPIANRWTKQSLFRNMDWSPRGAAQYEAELQSRTLETKDHREGVKALLEKRTPDFKGN